MSALEVGVKKTAKYRVIVTLTDYSELRLHCDSYTREDGFWKFSPSGRKKYYWVEGLVVVPERSILFMQVYTRDLSKEVVVERK